MTSTRSIALAGAAFSVLLLGAAQYAAAGTVNDTYTVEEDWVCDLNIPDTNTCSPQFFTAFPCHSGYIVCTWNFIDQPSYTAGGIQLQVWDASCNCLDTLDIPLAVLNITNDVVKFTLQYSTNGNDVVLKIVGCNSQSWNTNINTTSITAANANVANFNTYDPANSIAESGIQLGGNRVTWFGITGVRLYDDKGHKFYSDTTLRKCTNGAAN